MANKLGIALLCAALIGCDEAPDGGASNICGVSLTERPDEIPSDAAGYAQSARACVEQWSARLARDNQDDAKTVADAVIGTCAGELTRLHDDALPMVSAAPSSLPPKVLEYWTNQSLFIVVQTRAGDCYQGV